MGVRSVDKKHRYSLKTNVETQPTGSYLPPLLLATSATLAVARRGRRLLVAGRWPVHPNHRGTLEKHEQHEHDSLRRRRATRRPRPNYLPLHGGINSRDRVKRAKDSVTGFRGEIVERQCRQAWQAPAPPRNCQWKPVSTSSRWFTGTLHMRLSTGLVRSYHVVSRYRRIVVIPMITARYIKSIHSFPPPPDIMSIGN